jgi:hypothetical protein
MYVRQSTAAAQTKDAHVFLVYGQDWADVVGLDLLSAFYVGTPSKVAIVSSFSANPYCRTEGQGFFFFRSLLSTYM